MSGRTAAFILAAVTLLIVALSTGAAIYYLLLGMMVMMLGLGLISALVTLLTARVDCRCPQKQATRGDILPLKLFVNHYCPVPPASIRLVLSSTEDPDLVDELELHVPPFLGASAKYALRCPHRGRYTVGVTRIRVSDAFGLFSLSRKLTRTRATLTVLPRVERIPPLELESGDTGPEALSRTTEDMASPSGIRAYQEGDALKKVHWKLTMRKRELMVRTYEESARPDTLILMDCAPVSAMKSQARTVEDCLCEISASVALAQLSAGYPVRMPLMSQQPVEPSGQSSAEFGRFVDALTDLTFDAAYPYEQVLTLEMRRMQRTGGAVLVTPRLTARIADLALTMHRLGIEVCVCWVTDTQRADALALVTRLELQGVTVRRINPWTSSLEALAM